MNKDNILYDLFYGGMMMAGFIIFILGMRIALNGENSSISFNMSHMVFGAVLAMISAYWWARVRK